MEANNNQGNLFLTNETYNILKSVSKLTKFLSIVGFVLLGFSVFTILSMGVLIKLTNSIMEATNDSLYQPGTFSWEVAVVYLLWAVVCFIPIYYLYRFSVNLKEALSTNNPSTLTNAFSFLRKHYLFISALIVVIFIIYIIGIVIFVINVV